LADHPHKNTSLTRQLSVGADLADGLRSVRVEERLALAAQRADLVDRLDRACARSSKRASRSYSGGLLGLGAVWQVLTVALCDSPRRTCLHAAAPLANTLALLIPSVMGRRLTIEQLSSASPVNQDLYTDRVQAFCVLAHAGQEDTHRSRC
jgi:hypothetical protein